MVTGGAGFIGSHLCDALLERGDHVVCVDNLVGSEGSTRNIAHLLAHPRFELIQQSLLDWVGEADLSGVDCIFNQAASKNSVCLEDPERDLTVNGLGPLRLLSAAAQHGVRKFVHASTGSVFGETDGVQTTDAGKEPVSPYGISKLAGESYCRVLGGALSVDYTVLRYYHVIGPRQDDSPKGGVLPIFVRRCREGRPVTIFGTGEQTRSFTSVHDIVRLNVVASESPAASQRFFNCASGIRVSVRELAERVIAELGNPAGIEFAPARFGDIMHFEVDNAAVRDLGIDFDTDWDGMVREVIAAGSARRSA